ncbi:MAG TPA: hypothetical protein VMV17_21590 [Streptosporangiaceae bacterium]|nr:hypothetical protein [Streptosporangiaceae bacterium]
MASLRSTAAPTWERAAFIAFLVGLGALSASIWTVLAGLALAVAGPRQALYLS